MYRVMLARGNADFVTGINRGFGRFRSARLNEVVQLLERAQAQNSLDRPTLTGVLNALYQWRIGDPRDYADRGGTNGVAYRLWMETKQMLRNLFHAPAPANDPPMPQNFPVNIVLGVYVPPGEGHGEICHAFAYRWAVAAGRIREHPDFPARNAIPTDDVPRVLYPLGYAHYPAARAGGVIALQPGDIVAMFAVRPNHPPALGHSLIALAPPTTWFSANNAGTFGVGTGRSEINTLLNFSIEHHPVGWVGDGNQWMRPDDEAVHVVYRRT